MPEVAIGPAVPVFNVAYRMPELLRELRRLKPGRQYSLSADRGKPLGNIQVKIKEDGRESIVYIPARTRAGTWLLTPWQYLEHEIANAMKGK